jgi:hypothetical protein
MGARALLVALAAAAAVAIVPGSRATAPERGLFVPGESLGGVRVGMTKDAVKDVWGRRFGLCRSCRHTTWYFNYRPFAPEGVGVTFERGRASHVFTIWQPEGWRTPEGLDVGAPAVAIARIYGPLDRRDCRGYYALVERGDAAQTAYYVFDNEVWGFGLTQPDASPCL